MHRRHEVVVRLPHEAVGDVNDEGAGDGRRFDPVTGLGKDFEARGRGVGRYEGEAFEVCVGT